MKNPHRRQVLAPKNLASAARRGAGHLRSAPFVLPKPMSSERRSKSRVPALTLHDWEAKHYVIAAVIILIVMGLFAYSWS